MNSLLKIILVSTLCPCAVPAWGQCQTDDDQAKTSPPGQKTTFDTDSRASVGAFKDPLNCLFKDTQALKAKGKEDTSESKALIKIDLEQLRLGTNALTATAMTNPGMKILDAAFASAWKSGFSDFVSGVSQVRPDKQLDAQSTSSGTTSLVSKAGGSSILAFAVDAGALTSTTSGTNTTISGNLEGIGSLLLGQSPISIDPTRQNGLRKFAGDVNLQASFNLAQPSSKTTTATQPGNGTTPPAGTQVNIPSSVGKFTGLSAQFRIHNPFDPHSKTIRANWEAVRPDLRKAGIALNDATYPLINDLECPNCKQDWTKAKGDLEADAANNDQKKAADDFDAYVNSVLSDAQTADPDFDTKVVNAVKATAAYQSVVRQAVDSTLGNLFSLEYDFGRPLNQPETHDFKLVYGCAMNSTSAINSLLTPGSGAKSLFTANANISIYGGTIPASAKYGRLHYGQVSAEVDTPVFGGAVKQGVFTLAGYWQYQPSPSVLNITQGDVAPGTSIPVPTQVLVGTAGSLFVTQAKITIKNGKSGIDVPIGIKWSNKTDLLSGTKVGGQIGISYDFSTLSSLFGGGN